MNRKQIEIYRASVRRDNDLVTDFVRFARYVMRVSFYKFCDINILSNSRRCDSELYKVCIVSNSKISKYFL